MRPKEGSALEQGEDASGAGSGAADGYLWEQKELHTTSNLSSHGTGMMRLQGTELSRETGQPPAAVRPEKQGRAAQGAKMC